jgi:hypothetical protein
VPTENYLLEPRVQIKNKLVAVAPALVRSQNGSTCCRVLNLAPTPRRLAKNSPIAVLSPVNDRDQHNYEVLRQHSIFNLSEGKELTYNQKHEYLQSLCIPFEDTKLNSDQMKKLVDLLCKYKHIFAVSFTQLPGSHLIEHEIKGRNGNVTNLKNLELSKNPTVHGIVQRFW